MTHQIVAVLEVFRIQGFLGFRDYCLLARKERLVCLGLGGGGVCVGGRRGEKKAYKIRFCQYWILKQIRV